MTTDYYLSRGEAPSVFLTTNQVDATPTHAFRIGDTCLRATPAAAGHLEAARNVRQDLRDRKRHERAAIRAEKGWE